MPLVPLAGAWLVGVVLGALWPGLTPGRAPIAAAAAVLITAILPLVWGDRRARWIALGLVAGWLGLARTLLALPDPVPPAGSLRALNVPAAEARSVVAPRQRLRGRVMSDPVPARAGKASQVRIAVEVVQVGDSWQAIHGGLLALAAPFTGAGQGDLVEVSGVVQDPPVVADFDYAAWLTRHGIDSYVDHATLQVISPAAADPADLLARWRRDAGARTAALLPEPEAGLLRGIVLGQQKATDAAINAELADTGTSWIVVVSGLHFSILLGFVLVPLRRVLPLRPRLAVAGLLACLYALFVGLSVPVLRAALVGVLYLLGRVLGRPVSTLNLLAVAALLLTAADPLTVADASFQLSFASVLGILLLAPPLLRRWGGWYGLGEACAIAVAVELAIWPLIAVQFGTFAPISVPAGVAGGLLLGPIIGLGSLTELVAWLWLPAGQLLAWLCWLPLAALATVIDLAAKVPFLTVPDGLLPYLFLWYPALAAWYIAAVPRRRAAIQTALRGAVVGRRAPAR